MPIISIKDLLPHVHKKKAKNATTAGGKCDQDENTETCSASEIGHDQQPDERGFVPIDLSSESEGSEQQRREVLDQLRLQVTQVTQVARNDVNLMLERGTKLDSLAERAHSLQMNSGQFAAQSQRVRKRMCARNMKFTLLAIGLLFLVTIAAAMTVGFTVPFSDDGRHKQTLNEAAAMTNTLPPTNND